ncbi:carbonic anhydrase [Longispora sp. NPDC051575]|uniref:carbonic anhydrase n=1 Tax=Longispora sp. NPDC051575 TaxID=3154943 RepID=UPI003445E66C
MGGAAPHEIASAEAVHAARPGNPQEAWRALVAGNERFLAGRSGPVEAGRAHARTQEPYALVIGCLDSRVPPELVFDQGFGAVCVLRSGGHVLDSALLGSVEFTVGLGVPLIVVLGHQYCGAALAATNAVRAGERVGGDLGYLVDRIAPSVGESGDAEEVARRHTLATVKTVMEIPLVSEAWAAGRLEVVAARYDVESGRVERLL